MDHYTYRVTWSQEDEEFVGTCAEFPSLSHLDASRADALAGIEHLVADVVRDLRESGDEIPEPIADRRFSGSFLTRVPPELHRSLTLEAAEAGMSLSRLVNFKLTMPSGRVTAKAAPKRSDKRSA